MKAGSWSQPGRQSLTGLVCGFNRNVIRPPHAAAGIFSDPVRGNYTGTAPPGTVPGVAGLARAFNQASGMTVLASGLDFGQHSFGYSMWVKVDVVPTMMKRKKKLMTSSVRRQAPKLYLPGLRSP